MNETDHNLDPHNNEPDESPDAPHAPRGRPIVRWLLIIAYMAVFVVVFAVGVAIVMEVFDVSPDDIDYGVSPEVFGIVYIVVVVAAAYGLARWLITRHVRKTLWGTLALIVAVESEFGLGFTTREIHRMTDAGKFVQTIMARLRGVPSHPTKTRPDRET